MREFHFCLNELFVGAVRGLDVRWEATRGEICLHELVFLVPTVSEPDFEGLGGRERDVRDGEAAPIHINGRRRLAEEVHRAEGV